MPPIATQDQKEKAKEAVDSILARIEEEKVVLPVKAEQRRVAIGQILMQHKSGAGFDLDGAFKAVLEKYPQPKAPSAAPEKKVKDDAGDVAAAKVKDEAGEEAEEIDSPKKKRARAKKVEPKEEEDGEEETEEVPKAKKPRAPRKKKVVKKEEEEEGDDEDEEDEAPKKKKRAPPKKKAPPKKEDGDEEEDDEEQKKKKKGKIECIHPENQAMAALFTELGRHYFKEKDARKGAMYQKIYRAIMEAPFVITSGKQATSLDGIGKGTAEKIDEFLKTGKISAVEAIREAANDVM